MTPVIAFGHQPCGFIPRRFLYAKILSARELQSRIGGEVLFFYHDSDHDYRETIVQVADLQTGEESRINFEQENKLQKKYSPMYLKRIPPGWKEKMMRILPRFVDENFLGVFESVKSENVADFCLDIYRDLNLLEGVRVVRSSDPEFRTRAIELEEPYFADVEYEGEVVRAKYEEGQLRLHRGGGQYIQLPPGNVEKWQKSPTAHNRLGWMQSVLHITHYIMGSGEADYLDFSHAPGTEFLMRKDVGDLQAPILHRVSYPL